jgi:amidohydrolase
MKKITKSTVLRRAEKIRPEIIELKNYLGANPEVGLEEFKASKAVSGYLEQRGFRLERKIAGMDTAFIARWGDNKKAPHLALIGELDALPELGHACGHNVACAAAAGAAVLLAELADPDSLRLSFFGTPAEEIGQGKIRMIEAGAFKGIDAALMVHASRKRQVIKHFFGLSKLKIIFRGRASHAAAYPEDGINALDAVIMLFNGIGLLRQQLPDDVRIHGIITDGGVAPNIIPERSAAEFFVRANSAEDLELLTKKVIECARGAAKSTGCKIRIERNGYPHDPFRVLNSFYGVYSEVLKELGLPEAGAEPNKNKGSTDAGNLSQLLPTIHPHFPVGVDAGIHTREFARAATGPKSDPGLMEAATALTMTALKLVAQPDLLKKIKKEFAGR